MLSIRPKPRYCSFSPSVALRYYQIWFPADVTRYSAKIIPGIFSSGSNFVQIGLSFPPQFSNFSTKRRCAAQKSNLPSFREIAVQSVSPDGHRACYHVPVKQEGTIFTCTLLLTFCLAWLYSQRSFLTQATRLTRLLNSFRHSFTSLNIILSVVVCEQHDTRQMRIGFLVVLPCSVHHFQSFKYSLDPRTSHTVSWLDSWQIVKGRTRHCWWFPLADTRPRVQLFSYTFVSGHSTSDNQILS